MQKIFLWFVFLIVIGFTVSLNATSQNLEENYLYQTSSGNAGTSSSSGSPVAVEIETYIIVDGAGAGTVIHATADEPTSISPANNPITKANGHIGGIGVGEGMNCPGPLGHFHGTLKDSKDPEEDMCGWGHVSPLSQVSGGVQGIASAILSESFIIHLIEKEPPDYDTAVKVANELVDNLSTLQSDFRDPLKSPIGRGKSHQISDKLGKAINADKFVVMTLNPLPEKRDSGKDAAITLKINNALMAKQEAFMIFTEAEAMAALMAGMAMGE